MTAAPHPMLAGRIFHGEWETLASFTRKLLADRRNSYHEDDPRIRVMAAIAELWRRIDAREDLPDFGAAEPLAATWAEMLADVEEMAPRAAARAQSAARRPEVEAEHKRATERAAALAECLLYYHRPPAGSASATPLIVRCHLANQERRATAADRAARPAPAPSPLPPRAPRQLRRPGDLFGVAA